MRPFYLEELLIRAYKSLARLRPRLLLVFALAALTAFVMSGCSIGPLEIGGSSSATATPISGQGTSGTAVSGNPASAAPAATSTPAGKSLSGKVVDAYTNQPIGGAEITAAGILTETTSDGAFSFDSLPLNARLTAKADGYAQGDVDPGSSSNLTIQLKPNTISGRVTDGSTGKPLAGVLVKLVFPVAQPVTGTTTVTTTNEVTATVVPTATQPTTGTMGYGKGLAAPPREVLLAPDSTATASTGGSSSPVTATQVLTPSTPLPPTATPTPKPIPPTGPGFVAVYTNEDGSYFFKDVPQGAMLTFKMPGYKLTKVPASDAAKKDVALDVFQVHAAYITAPVAATKNMYDPLVDFISNSRFNAVVLNVQNDNSEWVFDTKDPDAVNANNTDVFMAHMADKVKALHDKGLYVIARVVTFQQPTMAKARLDMAVKSSVTGKAWLGGQLNQQAWIDPSNPIVQDYMLEMTKEVLSLGFDEIQYDYVRFPSDPAPKEPGDPVFMNAPTNIAKAQVLQQFLKKAHDLIEPTDAFMSIDVFGYTLWPDREEGPVNGSIGQVFEYLIDNTDYMAPMIYPSHFSPGESGCAHPAGCAYLMVHKSGEFAMKRFAGHKAKYRPWLEDFDWPPSYDYTSPGTTKVQEQIQAASETGAWGWMMWDPANDYEPRAVFKK